MVIAGLSRSPVVPETFMGLAECFISPLGAKTSVFMNIDTSTDDSLSPAPPKETRTREVCRPCDEGHRTKHTRRLWSEEGRVAREG